ncbi:uncharacterized protein [Miscanthus floridulus]|uniref:uncharacterized protein n=1 Tax=Miscanthus floridulus TaxID=154761 RepID=UPI003458ED0A
MTETENDRESPPLRIRRDSNARPNPSAATTCAASSARQPEPNTEIPPHAARGHLLCCFPPKLAVRHHLCDRRVRPHTASSPPTRTAAPAPHPTPRFVSPLLDAESTTQAARPAPAHRPSPARSASPVAPAPAPARARPRGDHHQNSRNFRG